VPARVSPRVQVRRRRFLLASAILATILAVAMVVVDNWPVIGKALERAWWTFEPVEAVTGATALPDYTGLDLKWTAHDRAATYTVTVASDAALTEGVERMTTTSSQVVLTGLAEGTTYFYRVNWMSELGNWGVASAVTPVTTAFHRVTAPSSVTVAATASDFSVSWAPVAWATDYIVRMSTSKDPAAFGSSPADAEYVASTGTTFITPELSKASTGEKYYFTVRANNRELSNAVSEPAGARLLIDPPKDVSTAGAGTTGVTLTWAAVTGAKKYVIERSTSQDFATIDGTYDVPLAYTRMSVNGLAAGTQYYFRVRAESGKHVGQASATIAGATLSTGAIDVRVATYNVLDPKIGNASLAPWKERRKNIARTIDSSGADIVALQEAGWSRVSDGLTPAQDLVKLTAKTLSISKAGYRGDQILYSASKYSAGRHGSFRLPRISGDGERSAIWQEFRDKATGAHFITVSTHLTSGINNNAGRVRQANAILAKLDTLNPDDLPIVLMGDLNSYDARADVTPMSLFSEAGYVDAELSTPETTTPNLNTWVKATSPTGSIRFDHIAVSDSVSVTRTAIEDPKLNGPASDHRLLWADIAIATS
jgi:endonuclease/exonuclease/phosphatase family metal-dependent hydrolase